MKTQGTCDMDSLDQTRLNERMDKRIRGLQSENIGVGHLNSALSLFLWQAKDKPTILWCKLL